MQSLLHAFARGHSARSEADSNVRASITTRLVSVILACALAFTLCPAALAYAAEDADDAVQGSAESNASSSSADRINEDVALDASGADSSASADDAGKSSSAQAAVSDVPSANKYTSSSNDRVSADVALKGDATVGRIEYNGFVYTIDVENDATVVVTGIGSTKPTGDVQIPAQIASGDKMYAVASISIDTPESANPYAESLFDDKAKVFAVNTISLPASIKSIDPAFFQLFPNATGIYVASDNETYASFDGALYSADLTQLILVPQGKGSLVLPQSLASVPAYVFSQCNKLSAISFEGVAGNSSFAVQNNVLYTSDMTTLLAAPAGLGASASIAPETKTIAEGAFYGNSALETIVVGGVVSEIAKAGDTALDNSGNALMAGSAMNGGTLPAFADTTVASATVVINVKAEGDEAAALIEQAKAAWVAYGFASFEEPAAPGTEVTPADGASGFAFTLLSDYTLAVRWEGVAEPPAALDIPDYGIIDGVQYTVSTVADNAFSNYTSIITVDLPQTVTVIGSSAFELCTNLQTIHFDSVVTIGTQAFANTALLSLVLPTTVQSIGDNAFSNMKDTTIVAMGSIANNSPIALGAASGLNIYVPLGTESEWDAGIPTLGNHIYPYGVQLSSEPLELEVGQTANILDGGYLSAPGAIETNYAYKANPISINTEDGTIEAKQAGSTYINVELSLTVDQIAVKRQSNAVAKLKPIATDGEEESDMISVPQTISLAVDTMNAMAIVNNAAQFETSQMNDRESESKPYYTDVLSGSAACDFTFWTDKEVSNPGNSGTFPDGTTYYYPSTFLRMNRSTDFFDRDSFSFMANGDVTSPSSTGRITACYDGSEAAQARFRAIYESSNAYTDEGKVLTGWQTPTKRGFISIEDMLNGNMDIDVTCGAVADGGDFWNYPDSRDKYPRFAADGTLLWSLILTPVYSDGITELPKNTTNDGVSDFTFWVIGSEADEDKVGQIIGTTNGYYNGKHYIYTNHVFRMAHDQWHFDKDSFVMTMDGDVRSTSTTINITAKMDGTDEAHKLALQYWNYLESLAKPGKTISGLSTPTGKGYISKEDFLAGDFSITTTGGSLSEGGDYWNSWSRDNVVCDQYPRWYGDELSWSLVLVPVYMDAATWTELPVSGGITDFTFWYQGEEVPEKVTNTAVFDGKRYYHIDDNDVLRMSRASDGFDQSSFSVDCSGTTFDELCSTSTVGRVSAKWNGSEEARNRWLSIWNQYEEKAPDGQTLTGFKTPTGYGFINKSDFVQGSIDLGFTCGSANVGGDFWYNFPNDNDAYPKLIDGALRWSFILLPVYGQGTSTLPQVISDVTFWVPDENGACTVGGSKYEYKTKSYFRIAEDAHGYNKDSYLMTYNGDLAESTTVGYLRVKGTDATKVRAAEHWDLLNAYTPSGKVLTGFRTPTGTGYMNKEQFLSGDFDFSFKGNDHPNGGDLWVGYPQYEDTGALKFSIVFVPVYESGNSGADMVPAPSDFTFWQEDVNGSVEYQGRKLSYSGTYFPMYSDSMGFDKSLYRLTYDGVITNTERTGNAWVVARFQNADIALERWNTLESIYAKEGYQLAGIKTFTGAGYISKEDFLKGKLDMKFKASPAIESGDCWSGMNNGNDLYPKLDSNGIIKWSVVMLPVYKSSNKITFDANGGSWADGSSTKLCVLGSGDTIVLPDSPIRPGYSFEGWWTSKTAGEQIQDGDVGVEGAGCFARWTKDIYKLQLSTAHGNPSLTEYSGTIDDTVDLPVLSQTGYEFNGWIHPDSVGNAAATKYKTVSFKNAVLYPNIYGLSVDPATNTITVLGVWDIIRYTLKYNANLASGAVTTGSFPADSTVTVESADVVLPDASAAGLSYQGHTLQGWMPATGSIGDSSGYTGSKAVLDLVSAGHVGAGNVIELLAEWRANSYYVNLEGGSVGSPVAASGAVTRIGPLAYGASLDTSTLKRDVYTNLGYEFAGWKAASGAIYDAQANFPIIADLFDNRDDTTKFLADGGDLALTADWSLQVYTISYAAGSATEGDLIGAPTGVPGGGAEFSIEAIRSADGVSIAPAASLTGFVFNGWGGYAADAKLSTDADFISLVSKADGSGAITLAGSWTPKTYSFELYANDGSGMSDTSYVAPKKYNDTAVVTLPNARADLGFNKPGYNASGWVKAATDTTGAVSAGTVSDLVAYAGDSSGAGEIGTVALYALWTAGDNQFTVIYHWQQPSTGSYASTQDTVSQLGDIPLILGDAIDIKAGKLNGAVREELNGLYLNKVIDYKASDHAGTYKFGDEQQAAYESKGYEYLWKLDESAPGASHEVTLAADASANTIDVYYRLYLKVTFEGDTNTSGVKDGIYEIPFGIDKGQADFGDLSGLVPTNTAWYSFDCWKNRADGTLYKDTAKLTVNDNTVLVPEWDKNIFTVKYAEKDGETGRIATSLTDSDPSFVTTFDIDSFDLGGTVTLKGALAEVGYSFKGWLASDGSSLSDISVGTKAPSIDASSTFAKLFPNPSQVDGREATVYADAAANQYTIKYWRYSDCTGELGIADASVDIDNAAGLILPKNDSVADDKKTYGYMVAEWRVDKQDDTGSAIRMAGSSLADGASDNVLVSFIEEVYGVGNDVPEVDGVRVVNMYAGWNAMYSVAVPITSESDSFTFNMEVPLNDDSKLQSTESVSIANKTPLPVKVGVQSKPTTDAKAIFGDPAYKSVTFRYTGEGSDGADESSLTEFSLEGATVSELNKILGACASETDESALMRGKLLMYLDSEAREGLWNAVVESGDPTGKLNRQIAELIWTVALVNPGTSGAFKPTGSEVWVFSPDGTPQVASKAYSN